MSLQHVGVGSFSNHMSRPNRWLRHYALFFDRIEIIDLDACLYQHRTDIHGKAETVRECDWLIESGFLSQSDPTVFDDGRHVFEIRSIDAHIARLKASVEKITEEYESHFEHRGFRAVPPELVPLLEQRAGLSWEISRSYAARAALSVRNSGRAIATCLEMPPLQSPSVDRQIDQADLLRFVIDGLPVPSRRVPWSEILAFKADDDSQERLRALRVWISATARGGISLAEASDQVSDALSRYQSHVRGAGVAHDLATWEALVKSGIVSPEQSLDPWLDSMAAKPFDISRYPVRDEQADRAAPGRELSFLVKVQSTDL